MTAYFAPVRELRFVIEELIGLDRVAALPGLEEATPDVVEAVLEEAARLAGEVWSPLNRSGDEAGCRLDETGVHAPAGFREAYQAFVEGGWNGIAADPDWGGQGLPELLACATQEVWNSANMALALCPLLTAGAVLALERHGSDSLKQRFLAPLVSGEWPGTMNLTEPQAGSDLSAINTRAVPEGDHYRITGQKLFITWGDHDMTENIVHLVLARTPDAEAGNRGISMFLVPHRFVDDAGRPGERNDVRCVALEHKLGIHASPTCLLSFGDDGGAVGYLVGEPGRGLHQMFTMMNEARHKVGVQAVGVCERAYQQARDYARERVQGRRPGGSRPAAIIHHPDVRRMLMTMRAGTEAMRALGMLAAAEMDVARRAPDNGDAAAAERRVALLTPLIKGTATELGHELTSLGVQVHGGMGYVEETGAAQYLRDARITTIYEGTTGIQAQDFTLRRVLRDGGETLSAVLDEAEADAAALAERDALAVEGKALRAALDGLRRSTVHLLEHGGEAALAGATPYLMQAGFVLGGWQMGRAAVLADRALEADTPERAFYEAKRATAVFYMRHFLPRADAFGHGVTDDNGATLFLAEEQF
ncbi:acyl-CoA dehydrogenase [Arhodomonas aquaeolei]|uniref:acyl-CoA dehydrogenase n=1 Tax=Arhodomonas aquaeolei TaxID=2369 RepID=UPI000364267B|nr:acyl-CoA dehydrogenase [Arhodomonas aquaeolei]